MSILILLLGLLLLSAGGHYLVQYSVSLARAMRISPLVISLTIIGCGTGIPELIVSVDASLSGYPDIALGNIIGSNIVNILVVVGLISAITPTPVLPSIIRRQGSFMVIGTIVLFLILQYGVISRISGFLLFAFLIAYIYYIFRAPSQSQGKMLNEKSDAFDSDLIKNGTFWSYVLFIIISMTALGFGAHFFVKGAAEIGRMFNVPEEVIGLTIVAVGTAAPEIFVSIIAAMRGHSDVMIGNILGSNIFNVLGISGITSMITPLPANPHYVAFDLPILLIISIAFCLYCYKKAVIGRLAGMAMVSIYVAYAAYLL